MHTAYIEIKSIISMHIFISNETKNLTGSKSDRCGQKPGLSYPIATVYIASHTV